MENIKQFDIKILNNHQCLFYPGQLIQGHVVVDTLDPIMTQGVVLQFVGCATVYWTEEKPGTGNRCIDIKTYHATEEYFSAEQHLFKPGILYPEEHKFDFQYKLPSALPENYEDELCLIEYYLEARIIQNASLRDGDIAARHDFCITNPLDLNNVIIPDVTLPAGQMASGTLCCGICTSLPINVTVHIKRSGYSPGQTITLHADIENNSSRTISRSYVRLMKERIYITDKKKRIESDEITRIERGTVRPHSCAEWNKVSLVIPNDPCWNFDGCSLFGIRYYIEMVVKPKGARTIVVPPIDILLGKVPLSRKSKRKPPHARLARIERTGNQKEKKEPADKVHVKSQRQRRKVRECRVRPSEETDTSGYVGVPSPLTSAIQTDNLGYIVGENTLKQLERPSGSLGPLKFPNVDGVLHSVREETEISDHMKDPDTGENIT